MKSAVFDSLAGRQHLNFCDNTDYSVIVRIVR